MFYFDCLYFFVKEKVMLLVKSNMCWRLKERGEGVKCLFQNEGELVDQSNGVGYYGSIKGLFEVFGYEFKMKLLKEKIVIGDK